VKRYEEIGVKIIPFFWLLKEKRKCSVDTNAGNEYFMDACSGQIMIWQENKYNASTLQVIFYGKNTAARDTNSPNSSMNILFTI
jgi:hypothetical protein